MKEKEYDVNCLECAISVVETERGMSNFNTLLNELKRVADKYNFSLDLLKCFDVGKYKFRVELSEEFKNQTANDVAGYISSCEENSKSFARLLGSESVEIYLTGGIICTFSEVFDEKEQRQVCRNLLLEKVKMEYPNPVNMESLFLYVRDWSGLSFDFVSSVIVDCFLDKDVKVSCKFVEKDFDKDGNLL